ncbi:hypothetical protein T5B8_00995 [Salinisphaera sp. T5B8]|uniref:hypothetical protein n=1 Tax=unclassified Salinisphaera TaxID=2649847 RepID=UPI00333FF599
MGWPRFITPASVLMLAIAGTAAAADNSGIVIIDQQQRSTPFGSYNSQRRTEVYGPSSGFRYEEYETPIQPVYPRYGYGRHGGYGYGPGYGGRGRVFEHNGAPAAPGVYGWGSGRGDRDHHPHRDPRPGYDAHTRRDNGRTVQPARRAVEPAQRTIEPAQRLLD